MQQVGIAPTRRGAPACYLLQSARQLERRPNGVPHRRVIDNITLVPRLDGVPRATARARAAELMDMLGLSDSLAERYPHEMSGGQRQRVAIARALALDPRLIIADEPTSALDVSVRAQVLNLLQDLKAALGLGLVFISHDINTVRYVSDRIAVMYLGRILETGPTEEIFARPQQDYTRTLLSAVPSLLGA